MTVSPSTIKAFASYSFTIDTSTIIPSGGMLTLQFPSQMVLTSNPSCVFQFGFTGVPTCSASNNILKIVGGYPSLNGIRFRINNVQNPGSALNLQGFSFKFFSSTSSTTPIDSSPTSSGFFFQYTTDTLISGNAQPSSLVVGEYSTWTLQITPKNQIPAGGIVKFFMPKWIDSTLHSITPLSMLPSGSNQCLAGTGLTSTSVSCTFTRDPSPTGNDFLTINNAFASAVSSSNYFEIKINDFRNMPTTRPYQNFEIWTYDSNGYGIDNLKAIEVGMTVPAILPASQASVIIEAPTTVDALTSYLFQIFVQNPIPMGGTIRIRIPPTIGATQLTTIISKQRINYNVKKINPITTDSNYIELIDGFPTLAESVPISAVVAFQLFQLRNPSTPSQTTSFEITTYEIYQGQSYPIEMITTGLQVAGSSGKITMNSYSFSDSRVLEYNTFSFDMVLQNVLTTGCSIQIQFPSEFSIPDVATGSCRLIATYGLSTSSTCQFVQNKMIISDPFGSAAGAGMDKVRFTIANNYVRNPTSTRPTSTGIVIKTMSANGASIDDWSGSKFTATENVLSSVIINPSSFVAGDYPVTYQFTIRTPYTVEPNAFIYVKFPTGDLYVYDTSIVADKCLAIATLSQSNIRCSARQTEITVTKAFPSGTCACLGDITFSVGGIMNPRSLKPTQTFTVTIYTSDNYLIYSKKTGITIKMTEPDRLTTLSISQVSSQNGAKDQFIFTVSNHNEMVDGDTLNVYFPPEISISNETACAARFGVRGFYKCTQDTTKKNLMIVSIAFSGRILGSVSIGRGFEFMLINIQNPPSMAPTSPFIIIINNVDGFNVSTINNGIVVANKKPSNMTSVSIKPSVYSDGKWTNLTFSVIPKNYMQFMTMTIQIPTDVMIAQAAPNLCQVISTYSISKEMVCDYQPGLRTIRILNGFQQLTKEQFDLSSILLRNLQFMIGQFINPIGVTKSGDFIFTSYDKQGYIIDQIKQTISYVCSPLCGSCLSDDYTKCISCPQNSTYKYLYIGQCVQSCPTGTTALNNKCLVCSNGCQDCSSENDTCITCAKNFFTLQGTCVASCPPQYTVELPNKCVSPIVPVVTFISYFQKRNDYQCFMFPLSAATILITIIMWIAVCCSKCMVSRHRERLMQQKVKPPGFLTPLRLVEICISLISLLELGGWGFFLYCMLDLKDQLPFYVICGALGLNLFLNFVMTCGIMRSKSNYDRYIQKYQDTYSCSYRIIQCLSLLISHKWFYISFNRYQRNRHMPSQFDFSYFDSGDEDGASGICFKFFFLASVLLLHGAVIAACVLNFLTNDLTKKLFCLDLDIIGMTGFQALLILLTLLQCGSVAKETQKVFPLEEDISEDGIKKKLNQTSAKSIDVDVDQDEEETQKPQKRDKKGRIIPEDSITQGKKNKKYQNNEDPFNRSVKKGKDKNDDPNFTRNLDRTIDPFDDEEIRSRPRRLGKKSQNNFVKTKKVDDEIDDGFQTIDNMNKSSRKRGTNQNFQEESDSAEEISNNVIKAQKKKPKKNGNTNAHYQSEESEEIEGPKGTKKQKKRGLVADFDEKNEDSQNESTQYDNRGKKLPKQNKKKKKTDLRSNGEDFGESDDEDYNQNQNKILQNRNKSKGKGRQNNIRKEGQNEDSFDESEEERDFDIKRDQKNKKQKKKMQVKNEKGQIIELEETDSEEPSEAESDNQQFSRSKKINKPKKKKSKKLVKNSNGQMVEADSRSEESDEDEDQIEDDEEDQKPSKKKGKQKKKLKKQVKNEKGQIVELTDSDVSSIEKDDEEAEKQTLGKKPNRKKDQMHKNKIKVKNEKGEIVELTEESSEKDEDKEQTPGYPQKKNIKMKHQQKKKTKQAGAIDFQDESSSNDSQIENANDSSFPSSQRKQTKMNLKKKKNVLNKNGSINIVEEEMEEEEEIEISEYYDEQIDVINQEIPGVGTENVKPKVLKKKKKKVIKKKTKGLNYQQVSHNATSDDELGEQKGIKFEKVRVDKQMQNLKDDITEGDEPSYRDLVDQINHEDGRIQPITEILRNPSAKFGTVFQGSQQQDEIQHQERVSAKFGVIHKSIPTEHDEEHFERNNADFGQIKASYPTQYDEKFLQSTQPLVFEQDDKQSEINSGLKQSKSQSNKQLRQTIDDQTEQFKNSGSPQSSISQEFIQDENGKAIARPKQKNTESKKQKKMNSNKIKSDEQAIEFDDISENYSSIQKDLIQQNQDQKKVFKKKEQKNSQLPEEAQFELKKSNENFKSPSMSLENNAPEEQRSVTQIKQGSPIKKLQNQDLFEDSLENEEEETKDKVNRDDIKPKTKIIFSDKSESSVEDLMEDTPSNYNLLNGRLDEDSKGLRSVMYKAISKKALYQNILDKSSLNHPIGAEDLEARQISQNGVQKRSAGRPPSTSSSLKLKKREQAKLFIQKAENAGISTLNQGSNLLQQQIELSNSFTKHQRNSSIGEITSSKLIDEHQDIYDPNSINKYASQMLIIPNTDTSANQK